MHTGFIVKNTFMNLHYYSLKEDKELVLFALISLVIFLRSFASKIIELMHAWLFFFLFHALSKNSKFTLSFSANIPLVFQNFFRENMKIAQNHCHKNHCRKGIKQIALQ